MTERPLKNVAASVRQRLMNSAKASGRPFQEVLQYFAMERFLYRLSQSPHAERFILKGALLFNLCFAMSASLRSSWMDWCTPSRTIRSNKHSGRDLCESRDWRSRPLTSPWLLRLSGIS